MWAIDELHGTFTFRNSYSISPQYMGDKVDRRILIWCTYSAIVKSVCRHNQLRICSETLCRSTPKTKVLRKIHNGTVISFFTFVDYQNRSGIKYRYKNNWVGDEIVTDYYTLGRGVLIWKQFIQGISYKHWGNKQFFFSSTFNTSVKSGWTPTVMIRNITLRCFYPTLQH